MRRRRGRLVFSFVGKSGVEHCIEIDDPLSIDAVEMMRRRRGGGRAAAGLQGAAAAGATSTRPRSTTTCARRRGADMTAKDFRTWHATVLAAAALAESAEPGDTKASRKRAVRQAMVEVSEYLGNTPAIAKLVLRRPAGGRPLRGRRHDRGRRTPRARDAARSGRHAIERAVLRMLTS